MSNDKCTEELFLNDVSNHSMKILRDDGVHRHLSFTNDGSSVYRFDLITWPGFLCIAGDCGTYVFRRINDMFEFFRMRENDLNNNPKKRLNINPGYWGEKLESIGTNAGYKEFDSDVFKESVKDAFDRYWDDFAEDDQERIECWSEVKEQILDVAEGDGEHEAYSAVNFFTYGEFNFNDFFVDGFSSKSYTFHYIWCLYAIVYGIKMYDKEKLK